MLALRAAPIGRHATETIRRLVEPPFLIERELEVWMWWVGGARVNSWQVMNNIT